MSHVGIRIEEVSLHVAHTGDHTLAPRIWGHSGTVAESHVTWSVTTMPHLCANFILKSDIFFCFHRFSVQELDLSDWHGV